MFIQSGFLMLVVILSLVSCDNDVSKAISAVSEIRNSDLNDVMEKADQDIYQPPADGKLTPQQLQMYIAVRKHETELMKSSANNVKRKVKKANDTEKNSMLGMLESVNALQEMANFATLDIRAAAELKFNTSEYQWVKNTLLDANAAMMMSKARNSMGPDTIKMLEQNKTDIQKALNNDIDPEMKKMLTTSIESIDKQIIETQAYLRQENQQSEDLVYNQALIKKHQDELNVINNEIKKWNSLEGPG